MSRSGLSGQKREEREIFQFSDDIVYRVWVFTIKLAINLITKQA
jgi:hypothetical protein